MTSTLTLDSSCKTKAIGHAVCRKPSAASAQAIAAKLTSYAGSADTRFTVEGHRGDHIVWMFTTAQASREEILAELLSIVVGNL